MNKVTRQVLGNIVMFTPILFLCSFGMYVNFNDFVYLVCAVLLVLDFIGWCIWFYVAGKKVLDGG